MEEFIQRFEIAVRKRIYNLEQKKKLLDWIYSLRKSCRGNFGKILSICERYNINLGYLFGEDERIFGYVKPRGKLENLSLDNIKIDSAYRDRMRTYLEKSIEDFNIKTFIKYMDLIGRKPYELIREE